MINIENLSKNFGNLKVLKNISTTINKGEIISIIGPSGSGKSTFLRCINKLEEPTEGHIYIDGMDLMEKNTDINKIRERVGMVFQHFNLFPNMTVLDNVKVALHNEIRYSLLSDFLHDFNYSKKEALMDEKAEDFLKVFELDEFKNLKAGNLAYGQQRKLEIARALATRPKLLLLDEPAAGMNPQETAELMDTIKLIREKYKITILLIEHDMKLVSGICEYLTVLNFGTELVSGTPGEVLNDHRVITAYLGE